MVAGASPPGSTVPGSLGLGIPAPCSRHRLYRAMLHTDMGSVTVRVTPRSGRTEVEVGPGRVAVRVRAAPEKGRATEEARQALAKALGVPASQVRLVAGVRSRNKVFEVGGLSADDVMVRLGAT